MLFIRLHGIKALNCKKMVGFEKTNLKTSTNLNGKENGKENEQSNYGHKR